MTERRTRGTRPRTLGLGAAALLALLAAGCSSSHASSPSTSNEAATEPPSWELTGSYNPTIDPANFVATIDNPYFPLEPGTAFHYKGMSEGTPQTDDMVVTDRTKQILGVTATVVEDTVSEHGKAIERTFDWYAQDKQGNVWYMGEDRLELHHGRLVRASDSWEAGVDGAHPGIIMLADPKAGDVYRQEYYPPGEALDQAHVRGFEADVSVPFADFKRALVTEEWSPVEPQLEQKSYVSGVGEVEEHLTEGGNEHFELVGVSR
jgi:hypothetical protein